MRFENHVIGCLTRCSPFCCSPHYSWHVFLRIILNPSPRIADLHRQNIFKKRHHTPQVVIEKNGTCFKEPSFHLFPFEEKQHSFLISKRYKTQQHRCTPVGSGGFFSYHVTTRSTIAPASGCACHGIHSCAAVCVWGCTWSSKRKTSGSASDFGIWVPSDLKKTTVWLVDLKLL